MSDSSMIPRVVLCVMPKSLAMCEIGLPCALWMITAVLIAGGLRDLRGGFAAGVAEIGCKSLTGALYALLG